MDTALAAVNAQNDIEALYRTDADRLWRAVYAFAGDPEIASDAVAEAYAQLLRRGAAVGDPLAWVWRAAFQISRGALKVRRRDDGASPAVADHVDAYADLPIRQIAERLGTNSLAVRANLSRGRRRLRELLGDRDG